MGELQRGRCEKRKTGMATQKERTSRKDVYKHEMRMVDYLTWLTLCEIIGGYGKMEENQ